MTEPTLTIEAKGFDAGEAVNRLSIMMASNEDWVCPASNDERRFAVFNVSDARRNDQAYFAALIEEIKGGGAEAFFADMLAIKLDDWHPRNDVPETEGLAMQKQESAGPELQWLWNILEEGMLPEALQSYTDLRLVPEAPDMARSLALFQNCNSPIRDCDTGSTLRSSGNSCPLTALRSCAGVPACSCNFHRSLRSALSFLN